MGRKDGAHKCIDGVHADVQAALKDGDEVRALYAAQAAFLAALADDRKHKPTPEAMLKHAEYAGLLAAMAVTMRDRPATKPLGYTGGPPSARDLVSVFTETFKRSVGRLTAKGATNG